MFKSKLRAIAIGGLTAAGLALAAAPSLAASSLPTLTLAVTKNAITVGGSMTAGATQIVTTVSGEPSDTGTLLLLKPGVTISQFQAVVSKLGDSPLDALDPYATIVYSSSTATTSQSSTGQVVLEPGTYVAVNNGNGHAVFTVTGSASSASLPAAGATVTSIDFAFRGATTLHDGELVRFHNDGYLVHMFEAAPVGSVAAAKKGEALLLAGKMAAAKKLVVGPPLALSGMLSSGQSQNSVITAAPGVYVMLCLMNTEDGREHYQLGMVRTITIRK